MNAKLGLGQYPTRLVNITVVEGNPGLLFIETKDEWKRTKKNYIAFFFEFLIAYYDRTLVLCKIKYSSLSVKFTNLLYRPSSRRVLS